MKVIGTTLATLLAAGAIAYAEPTAQSIQNTDTKNNSDLTKAQHQPKLFSSMNWKGVKVKNQEGEEVGTTQKVLVDEDGVVQFVVLRTGELIDATGRLITVPFNALSMGTMDNDGVRDAAVETNAPSDRAKDRGDEGVDDKMVKRKPLFATIDASEEQLKTAPTYVETDEENRQTFFQKHFGFWGNSRSMRTPTQGAE